MSTVKPVVSTLKQKRQEHSKEQLRVLLRIKNEFEQDEMGLEIIDRRIQTHEKIIASNNFSEIVELRHDCGVEDEKTVRKFIPDADEETIELYTSDWEPPSEDQGGVDTDQLEDVADGGLDTADVTTHDTGVTISGTSSSTATISSSGTASGELS